MIKYLYYGTIFLSIASSQICLSTLHNSIINSIDDIIKITFDLDLEINNQISNYDSTILFIDNKNNQIRMDYNNQIQIFNLESSINLFTETNQLYIDESDTALINMITDFFDSSIVSKFKYDNQKINPSVNDYILKNEFNFKEILISLNSNCSRIVFIRLDGTNLNIYINNIIFDYIENNNKINPFNLYGDYFEFDLRRHD